MLRICSKCCNVALTNFLQIYNGSFTELLQQFRIKLLRNDYEGKVEVYQ